MTKNLAEKLLNGEIDKDGEKSKPLTLALPTSKYDALHELSQRSNISKARIVIMALDEAGVFNVDKSNKRRSED